MGTPSPAAGAPQPVPAPYLNRERAWLQFNARVLAEAASPANPLLERLRFLAITASNLDEFFMVRAAGIHRQLQAGVHALTPDGLTPAEQLELVVNEAREGYERQSRLYHDIVGGLERHGLQFVRPDELTVLERAHLREYYRDQVHPVLTPLAVDPSHPFPFVSNLSLNLAVALDDAGERLFARVKVPVGILPRLVPIAALARADLAPADGDGAFILLEDVIRAHIGELFAGMSVVACQPFRVTRDADLEVDEEDAEDLLDEIEQSLRRRRFGDVVRLEVGRTMPEDLRAELAGYLEVPDRDVFRVDAPLGLADLGALADVRLSPEACRELLFPGFTPGPVDGLVSGVAPDAAAEADGREVLRHPERERWDPFAAVRARDVLLHHPYQSFAPLIETLRLAARDPQVLAIKMTLYRTGGDPGLLEALLHAAEAGKQVVALIELKARFDEERNITWARALERAGVHVVYGVPGLKTHAKALLVIRREPDGLRRYVHVSTGNYNPRTARLYTDVGLVTADPELGEDAGNLFNELTGYSETPYRAMAVAPRDLRTRLLALIAREAQHARDGRPARLVAKMNSLTDTEAIDALYRASAAGLQVDLIVRGVCCLRPGVPGLSETIRVRSVIGRFLEHSRIVSFENGGEPEVYLSSADWMGRNLSRRIELLVPVRDPQHAAYLRDVALAFALADNAGAWELGPDGRYARAVRPAGEPPFSSQLALARLHGHLNP